MDGLRPARITLVGVHHATSADQGQILEGERTNDIENL
jgi:hypothetical protein